MDIVIHVASPYPSIIPKKEIVLIKPAVEGTLAAIRGVHRYKVKRIVITSSIGAVVHQDPGDHINEFDEINWSRIDHTHAYNKSKVLAERSAWDYLAELPEIEKFEMVTICPGLLMGPSFIKS